MTVKPVSAGVSPAKEIKKSRQDAGAPGKASAPKGWYSRDYLPHCDAPGLLQMITFRLADALPEQVVRRFELETSVDAERRKKIEMWLDAGHGECVLQDPWCAEIVERALWHFDGKRYRLLAWCVMPNHVHVLVEMLENSALARAVHSWKSYSAKQINKQLGRTGALWQREYFDRYIRNDAHLKAAIDYIHRNPVKAGLVAEASDWLFSSARFKDGQAGEAAPR